MITNVCMLVLREHDLEKAIEFYQKIGLPLKFQIKGSWAEFEIYGIKIGLCPTSQEAVERQSGIVFQVDNLRAFYEKFKNEIPFKMEPVEKIHGILATIQDPGGNLIDLYEPTPQKVQELVKKVIDEDLKNNQSVDSEDDLLENGPAARA